MYSKSFSRALRPKQANVPSQTPEQITSHLASAKPVPRPLTPWAIKSRKVIDDSYAKFASAKGGVTVGPNPTKYYTFAHATARGLPHWSKIQLHQFLKFYAYSTPGKHRNSEGRMVVAKTTMVNLLVQIAKNYRKEKGEKLPKTVFDEGLKYIGDLSKDLKMNEAPRPRAELTSESILGLVEAVFDPSLNWSMDTRLRTLLFITTSTSTGARGCSLLSYGVADSTLDPDLPLDDPYARSRSVKLGSRWSDWVFTQTAKGPSVTFRPCGGKTSDSRLQSFPLSSSSYLGLSSAQIAMTLAYHDGVFEKINSIDELLNPVLVDGKDRVLRMHPVNKLKFVIPSTRDHDLSACSVRLMNSRLRALSRIAGFELDVTCHCFRHLVLQVIFAKLNITATTLQGGHAGRGRSFNAYSGGGATAGAKGSLGTGAMAEGSMANHLYGGKRSAVVERGCPAGLSLDATTRLLNTPAQLRVAQRKIKADVALQYPAMCDAPTEIQVEYRRLASKYGTLSRRLIKASYLRVRARYIEELRQARKPDVDEIELEVIPIFDERLEDDLVSGSADISSSQPADDMAPPRDSDELDDIYDIDTAILNKTWGSVLTLVPKKKARSTVSGRPAEILSEIVTVVLGPIEGWRTLFDLLSSWFVEESDDDNDLQTMEEPEAEAVEEEEMDEGYDALDGDD